MARVIGTCQDCAWQHESGSGFWCRRYPPIPYPGQQTEAGEMTMLFLMPQARSNWTCGEWTSRDDVKVPHPLPDEERGLQ